MAHNNPDPRRAAQLRRIALPATLLLGAFLRFAWLPATPLAYDEAYQAYDALRLLDGREWLLIGQASSVFLDNPPLMAYLQAIPLLVWRSPWAVYLFVTTLNTIAIWFVYRAVRAVEREELALIAAFLFAVNPWIVHFSRMPWAQGLLPFFMAVIAWGAWPVFIGEQSHSGRFIIALLALTLMSQTYILAFAFVIPLGLLLLIFRQRVPGRPLLIGAAFFGLGLLAFGVGVASAGAHNTARLQSFFGEVEPGFRWQALEHTVRLVTGLDYEGRIDPAVQQVAGSPFMEGAHLLLLLALIAGGVQAVLALRTAGRRRRLAVVLLIWLLVPTLGLALLPYLVHPHYLLLTLPAGPLLAAWGLEPLLDRPRLRLAPALLLPAVGLLFALSLAGAAKTIAAAPRDTAMNGWPLADAARVGRTIRELVADPSAPQRMVAPGSAPLLSTMSATYVEPASELAYPDYVLLPGDEPLLYLLLGDQQPTTRLLGPAQQLLPEREIVLGDGTRVNFVQVPVYERPAALALPDRPVGWSSDAGLTLLGYDLEPASVAENGLTVTTYWRVEELHPARGEWFVTTFYQVLNGESQMVANVGGRGQWGDVWRSGDIYVERVVVPLPADLPGGQYALLFGLFDPIHTHNFLLHAPEGNIPHLALPIEIGETGAAQ